VRVAPVPDDRSGPLQGRAGGRDLVLRGHEGEDEGPAQDDRPGAGRRLHLRRDGAAYQAKLVLAWHLGKRTTKDTDLFVAKLAGATAGNYQLSTDGWGAYPAAVEEHLGGRVDYAQSIKTFLGEGLDSERRYSPPSIIASEKRVIAGDPDRKRVCTSHVERQNLHMRMQLRRFTRLTNAFSRKRENLKAALALHFAAFNFCWMHSTLRMTPAMKAGLVRKPWTVQDLLMA
jgi:IS1 family transposase